MSIDKPSYLLEILKITTNQIFKNIEGLNDKEFNNLCSEDHVFKKNLLLEIKDIDILVDKLRRSLKAEIR